METLVLLHPVVQVVAILCIPITVGIFLYFLVKM